MEATREGKRLRVEVKGMREQWSSVALTPTEIKWAYKTVQDEKEEDLLLNIGFVLLRILEDYTITPSIGPNNRQIRDFVRANNLEK